MLASSIVCSQESEIIINKNEDKQLINILNNSELLSKNETDNLSIRIFIIGNNPGSAGFESGEITHNLLIAVSEFDEYPKQNLYEIGPFYNPIQVNWRKNHFELLYGETEKPKKKEFEVTIDEISEVD